MHLASPLAAYGMFYLGGGGSPKESPRVKELRSSHITILTKIGEQLTQNDPLDISPETPFGTGPTGKGLKNMRCSPRNKIS